MVRLWNPSFGRAAGCLKQSYPPVALPLRTSALLFYLFLSSSLPVFCLFQCRAVSHSCLCLITSLPAPHCRCPPVALSLYLSIVVCLSFLFSLLSVLVSLSSPLLLHLYLSISPLISLLPSTPTLSMESFHENIRIKYLNNNNTEYIYKLTFNTYQTEHGLS